MVESSSSAQCLVFSQVYNLDLGEFIGGVLDEVPEDRLFVVSDYADLLDVGDLCDGGETVPDDGMASDVKEGLFGRISCWQTRMMFGIVVTLGRSRDNGLNRVPREGPPTCSLSTCFTSNFPVQLTRSTALVRPCALAFSLTASLAGMFATLQM